MTANYFIRPCGNYDSRSFTTLQSAIEAAIESAKATGYSCDVFDHIEKRGIVAAHSFTGEIRYLDIHALANA